MSLLRHPAAVAVLLGVLLVPAVASAHEGHAALPDDLRAQITQLQDASGRPADLPGVTFSVAPGGIGLTVRNTGSQVVEVTGEQAGEPLLRVTADKAWVNQASPQAKDVAGATVDPDAAGELIDLLWDRVPADWVPLPEGGSVFLLDHRGAPGHAPAPGYGVGDVVGEFGIDFTIGGTAYAAAGAITAVTPPETPGLSTLWITAGIVVAAALALMLARAWWTRRPASDRGAPVVPTSARG